jgi:hypothetical protein
MATALPPLSNITSSTETKAQLKAAMSDIHDYLVGLLGTDGLAATALATLMASFSGYLAKSTTYTVVAADKGKVIDCTGSITLNLLAAATAGTTFMLALRNSGGGTITLDANASELIDGNLTTTLLTGESCILICTGSAWVSIGKTNTPVPTTGVLVGIDYVTATGAYSKTAPAGATRALVKVQAGGGQGSMLYNTVGGVGGYAEKFITGLTGGSSSISGVVGAASSASTITSPVTVTCSAGASAGASDGTGGAASGGDWNVTGGASPSTSTVQPAGMMGGANTGYGYGGNSVGSSGGQGIVIIEWYK